MSRIFISHSSTNNAEAIALRDWLATQGFDDVFLDIDPDRGLKAGERWEQALNAAASRCEAVLFLVSRNWIASSWCRKEMSLAHRLNKRMFGVLIEELPIEEAPRDLSGEWQLISLASGRDGIQLAAVLPVTHAQETVTFSAEGLQRLRHGLENAGLDPKYFAWPPEADPDRPPYRGFLPLEAEDAGIYFGREAEIVVALDALRGLREAAAPRIFVMLGASGAGKSSMLRAGLIPRLSRDDRHFLPLPVIRPERAAISGEAGLLRALEGGLKAKGISRARADLRSILAGDAEPLKALLQELVERSTPRTSSGSPQTQAPTVVLCVDQAEELFNTEGADEAQQFLGLLADLVKTSAPDVIAVFTIRTDAYEPLQSSQGPAAALAELKQETFSLPPMAQGSYQSVIEGPATRLTQSGRKLTISPDLTATLLRDIEQGGAKDALPLLAFTLERLYVEHGGDAQLSLADYEALGGIKGAIEAAIDQAFAAANADPRIPRDAEARRKLLRRGLIPWLAGIDPDTASPRRRVARLSQIPSESRPLIDLLVKVRLLATDRDAQSGEATIEPAHEALLRQWGTLQGWLEEDFAALAILEGVKRAARDWDANGKRAAWLAHSGTRLDEAERVAPLPAFDGFLSLSDRMYLKAARAAESARAKRERWLNNVSRVAAVVALIGMSIAAWQAVEAYQQARIAENQKQEAERQSAIALETTNRSLEAQSKYLSDLSGEQIRTGDSAIGFLLALEALPRTNDASSLFERRPLVPNAHVALGNALNEMSLVTVRELRASAGILARSDHARCSSDLSLMILPNGPNVSTVDYATGRIMNILDAGTDYKDWIYAYAIDQQKNRIATITEDGKNDDGTMKLWELDTGKLSQSIRLKGFDPKSETIKAIDFYEDRVLGVGYGTIYAWAISSGDLLWSQSNSRSKDASRIVPGKSLLAVSEAGALKFVDIRNGEEQYSIPYTNNDEMARVLSIAPNGNYAYTAHTDYTIRGWDISSRSLMFTYRVERPNKAQLLSNNLPRNLQISADGKFLAIGLEGGAIALLDASNGRLLREFKGHEKPVNSLCFDKASLLLHSHAEDGTFRTWRTASEWQRSIKTLDGAAFELTNIILDPQSGFIAAAAAMNFNLTASMNQQKDATKKQSDTAGAENWGLHVLDARKGTVVKHIKKDSDFFRALAEQAKTTVPESPARYLGAQYAAKMGKRAVVVWWSDFTALFLLALGGGKIEEFGSLVFPIELYDLPSGELIKRYEIPSGKPSALASSNEVFFAAGSDSGDVFIFKADSTKPIAKHQRQSNEVTSLSFSKDEKHLLVGYSSGQFDILRSADWKVDASGRCPGYGGVKAASFVHGEEKFAIMCGTTGQLQIFDFPQLRLVREFPITGGYRSKVPFSTTSNHVFLINGGDEIEILDVVTGKTVHRYSTDAGFSSFAFDDETRMLVAGTADNKLVEFRVPIFGTSRIAFAEGIAPRCLTKDERFRFHLEAEPPRWCITGAGLEAENDPAKWQPKWPYQSPAWRDWLIARDRGEKPSMP